jgi:hypothetical protein
MPKTAAKPTIEVPDAGAAFIRLTPQAASRPANAVTPDSVISDTVVELPSGVVLRFSGLLPVAYLQEVVGLTKRDA